MVKMQEEPNTPVSNWWLYIGVFLCCTRIGMIPGAIFIANWANAKKVRKEMEGEI